MHHLTLLPEHRFLHLHRWITYHHRIPAHRVLAKSGKKEFYEGRIGKAIVEIVQKNGGILTLEDMKSHTTEKVKPIFITYKGIKVWEIPPNGQGITALMTLNILENFNLRGLAHNSADYLHVLSEAVKLSFSDTLWFCTDPSYVPVPTEELLSKAYCKKRSELINMQRASVKYSHGDPFYTGNDTVYFTVMDAEGNACSFINSNYLSFGTGLVPESCGFSLQCRGANFSLSPGHPNCLAPGKRPFHTIIPAMATAEDTEDLLCSFGVMGGFMQPQGHVQVLLNMAEFGMNPQQAVDAPRFCVEYAIRVPYLFLYHLPPCFYVSLGQSEPQAPPWCIPRCTGEGKDHFGRHGPAGWRESASLRSCIYMELPALLVASHPCFSLPWYLEARANVNRNKVLTQDKLGRDSSITAKMCFEKCAKGIGYNLLALALFCIVANILLYFPNGETIYARKNELTDYVWYFHGIVGAGLLMFLPASVFIGLEHEDCCGCCGHATCGKRCAMLSSIIAALIGLVGSGYCVIISALALVKGPYCNTGSIWTYQFANTSGGYLTQYDSWSQCTEPKHIVEWNVALFAILLGLAGIQFILCLVQIINGLIGGICGYCCSSSQQSYVC
uniref:Uncharacterized protein LOC117366595 isoform X2 n=1 Tax=Geotrypetes seraphini TaxID=260995 RepID=A0A6P8S6R5_GEOSA|nr:uncharacterized protein LOC117366595 isoform X2 [Geotrypetes seraphini]